MMPSAHSDNETAAPHDSEADPDLDEQVKPGSHPTGDDQAGANREDDPPA